MKFLKKASLAAAIAAAPFAVNAEMVALDDATMSATTGQAGVTIEINIDTQGISIGEIEYKDEGSVLLQNVTVKNVTNLKQTIDVDTNGNLLLGMTGVNDMEIAGGGRNLQNASTSAVALKSAAGEVTELVNNFDLTLDLGASTTTILNLAAAGNAAAKAALPSSAQEGSVAILSTSTIDINSMNVGAFGYTQAQADTLDDTIIAGVAGSNATATAKANELIAQYNTATSGSVAAAVSGTALTTDQQNAVNAAIADGSAVKLSGVQFYAMVDHDNNAATPDVRQGATIDQTIWAKGGSAALGGGVYIQINSIKGTLDIAGIEMGGASIGSVKVSDLNLAGMTQRIYGH